MCAGVSPTIVNNIIIGKNGSGKSTLLQVICGTLTPTAGEVRVNGRIAALLELGSGFNPEFTGRENVYLNGSVLGLTRAQVDERLDGIGPRRRAVLEKWQSRARKTPVFPTVHSLLLHGDRASIHLACACPARSHTL